MSLRTDADGKRTEPFKQKNGIRQGSSLSPLIFVLVLDFCMRVTEAAMAAEGYEDRPDPWGAYADDIADETVGDKAAVETEASEALQQLQGAAAVAGLLVNVNKTEVMARRMKLAETTEKAAWKERFELKSYTGRLGTVVGAGWVAHAKWAARLGCVADRKADAKRMEEQNSLPAVILKLDKGVEMLQGRDELVLVDIGRGYARDAEYVESKAKGRAKGGRVTGPLQWGLSRLGFFRCMNGAQLRFVDCERCGCTFRTPKGLRWHQERHHCKKQEELTEAQQKERRKGHNAAEKEKGVVKRAEEKVTITACGGGAAKVCGKFVYLGTLLSPGARTTEEITRRC